MSRKKFRVWTGFLVSGIVALSGFYCSRQKTDKELILELVDRVGEHAENKQLTSILEVITEDFSDMEKRAKTQIEAVLSQYFDQYPGIVINILGTKFNDLKPFLAEIEIEISLSSGGARMLRKWISYAGQTYRFQIRLKKMDQDWKVFYAEWKPVFIEELFPDSLEILKQLFPKL